MSDNFDVLVRASRAVEATVPENGRWKGSPFEWLRRLSPSQKGRVGERIVAFWLTEMGFEVKPCSGRGADLQVGAWRVEVKFSTLWQDGFYSFQQIRDQDYDRALFLGVSPSEAHAWFIPKPVLMEHWTSGVLISQHAGKKGKDTAWVQVRPEAPPAWLTEWGGSLEAVAYLIRADAEKVPEEERRGQMPLFRGSLQPKQSGFDF